MMGWLFGWADSGWLVCLFGYWVDDFRILLVCLSVVRNLSLQVLFPFLARLTPFYSIKLDFVVFRGSTRQVGRIKQAIVVASTLVCIQCAGSSRKKVESSMWEIESGQ